VYQSIPEQQKNEYKAFVDVRSFIKLKEVKVLSSKFAFSLSVLIILILGFSLLLKQDLSTNTGTINLKNIK
jgi:hypothetical protein